MSGQRVGLLDVNTKPESGSEALIMAVFGLTVTCVLLLVGVVWMRVSVIEVKEQIRNIRTEQTGGAERGYKNRAAACRITVLLGANSSPECMELEVIKYFDPGEQPTAGANSVGQVMNRKALCDILRIHGISQEQSPILKDPACT